MNTNSVVFLENYLQKQFYICKSNETLGDIAKKFNVQQNNLLVEGKVLKEGDFILINKVFAKIYVVKPNDSLQSIAKKFDTTVQQILNNNGINNIFIGQQLYI